MTPAVTATATGIRPAATTSSDSPTDLLAVRDHFSADTPPAVVGASLGGMTVLGAHLLAPADVVGGGRPGRRHAAVGV